MARIMSTGLAVPEQAVTQEETMEFVRQLFAGSVRDIDRLLKVFQNGEIEKRHFAKDMDWYQEEHSFEEKNEAFIETAVPLCIKAIENCLGSPHLGKGVPYEEIDAIVMVCTTGLATPSLEARIMNKLPFSLHTKRIPIWGLGCAGGAGGLSRAFDYCKAHPKAKVLVVAVELCSLTFQKDDLTKSNIIGTSLFADGAAAVLVCGEEAAVSEGASGAKPVIIDTFSSLMPDSLDVMGWDIKNNGLYVVFSKSIPNIVESWLAPQWSAFLEKHRIEEADIRHFIAHPGGKKVIDAYEHSLGLTAEQTACSKRVMSEYGNMSSPTVLFVLDRFLEKEVAAGEYGMIAALGPGFSSELLLVRWEAP